MKFFDLFCGAGGLSLGLAAAGLKPLGGMDVNEAALISFRRNLARFNKNLALVKADAFKFPPVKLAEAVGELDPDLVVGCPPCQGFSRLRVNRFGPDKRNDLILYFAEAVKLLKPSHVFFENVPGIVRDARFQHLLSVLREEG